MNVIEALAKENAALAAERDTSQASEQALALLMIGYKARAEAAEAKVANERSIWVTAIETYFDATAVMDVETYARKLRLEITK